MLTRLSSMAFVPCLLLCALLSAAPPCSEAQFGMPKKDPPPKAPYRKDDIKFIECQTCEAIVKQSLAMVKAARAELAAGKRLNELTVLEKLETMCDPDTDPGEWVSSYDLVEDGTVLKLYDTGSIGQCKSECRTLAKACEKVSEQLDLTELSAFLISGKKKRSALTQWACYEETNACVKKPPSVPPGRPKGEKHVPMSAEEVRNARLLRSMKAAGMSGTMYDRESLMNGMMDGMGTGAEGEDPTFINEEDHSTFGGAESIGSAGSGHYAPDDSYDDGAGNSGGAVNSVADDIKQAAGAVAAGVESAVGSVKAGVGKLHQRIFGKTDKEQAAGGEGSGSFEEL